MMNLLLSFKSKSLIIESLLLGLWCATFDSDLMEKFNAWRDSGTGIHPFLVPKPKPLSTLLSLVKYRLVGPVLVLARLLLLLATALLFLVLDLAGLVLFGLIPAARYWWNRVIYILLRLALFIMGFYYIKSTNLTLKKDESAIEMLICNHSSYVDILYLGFRYNPQFTRLAHDQFIRVNIYQALYYSVNLDIAPASKNMPLRASTPSQALCVFPEAATSNSTCLLKPLAGVLESLSKVYESNLATTLGITYPNTQFSPSYNQTSSFAVHLSKLLCQFSNYMCVVVSQAPVLKSMDVLCKSTRLFKTSKTALDKLEFIAYYNLKK